MSSPTQNSGGFGDILSFQLQNSIVKELFDSIKNINISLSDTYPVLINKVLYIVIYGLIVMTIQSIVMKGSKDINIVSSVWEWIKSLFVAVFYKRITLVLNATHKYKTNQYNGYKIRDYVYHRHLQEELYQIELLSFLDNKIYFKEDKSPIITQKSFYLIPIYFYATRERVSDNIEVNYEYCIIHSYLINKILIKAYEYERSNIMIPVGEEKILYSGCLDDECEDGVGVTEVVADSVYETHNVRGIKGIIQDHIRICNAIGNYPQCPILINGEPGLGKTKVADYIAYNRICDRTYVFDMTKFRTHNFKDFLVNVATLIDERVPSKRDQKQVDLVMFDEIDKYIDFWIDNEYDKYTKIEKESNKSNKNVIDLETKEDFERRKKKDFLYQLLELIETRSSKSYRIYIFCANNFWSLFDNLSSTDMLHLASLKKRLINIFFKLCDKEEITRLVNFYNDLFKVKLPEKYIPEPELAKLIANIPEDISMTMRDVYQQLTINRYDLKLLVCKS